MDTVVIDPKAFLGYDAPVLAHLGQKPEMVVYATDDERLWVPFDDHIFFRPLFFDMANGGHCELLKVTGGGVLGRHRHTSSVHGYVIKGKWRYLEHSWEATEGSYVFEAPGEVHTLVVDDDVDVQHALVQLEQLEDGDHDVIDVTEAASLELLGVVESARPVDGDVALLRAQLLRGLQGGASVARTKLVQALEHGAV